MSVILRTLNANDTLANHQETFRQSEELSYSLISFTIGRVSGKKANLAAFSEIEDIPPENAISLKIIDGGLDQDVQEAGLNAGGKQIVCYGSLYVQGKECNVLAYRETS